LTREEFVADCRASCIDEDMWNQEYMCIAAISLAAVLSYITIESCEHDDCPQPGEPMAGYEGRPAFIGVDVGRTHDKTVIWALEPVGDVLVTRQVKVLTNMPLPEQQQELGAIIRAVRPGGCRIDETGIGLGCKEYSAAQFGAHLIQGVTFTNPEKHALVIGVKQRFEDRGVRIPADNPALRDSLHRVRKAVTPAGNVVYDAASDATGHADEFWALALAVRAAGEGVQPWDGSMRSVPREDAGMSAVHGFRRMSAVDRRGLAMV